MKKLKIVFAVTVDHAVPYHRDFAYALAELGHEVHFVSSPGTNLLEMSSKVKIHPIPMQRGPNPLQDLRAYLAWRQLLRTLKPDFVIGGTPKASLLAMLSSKFARIPRRVYYCHGLRLETSTGLSRRLLGTVEKFVANCATEIIAVSPSLKSRLVAERIAKSERISVLGAGSTFGIDLSRFHPGEGTSPATPNDNGPVPRASIIGFVGRITKDKGIAELLEAVEILRDEQIPFHVVLLGEVEDQDGVAFLEQLTSSEIPFQHLGHVEDPETYLRTFDVLCLPSHREGLGLVILEAFASGVPVVATSVTGISDIVENESTGILVPPRDGVALSKALARVLTTDPLRANLAANALEFVTARFEKQIVIDNHLQHFLNPSPSLHSWPPEQQKTRSSTDLQNNQQSASSPDESRHQR